MYSIQFYSCVYFNIIAKAVNLWRQIDMENMDINIKFKYNETYSVFYLSSTRLG